MKLAFHNRLRQAHRLPLILTMLGAFDLAFLAFATQFIETALAAAIFEVWPFFFVYALTRLNRVDRQYRGIDTKKEAQWQSDRVLLTLFATVGLLFMLVSQAEDLGASLSPTVYLGVIIAILGATAGALTLGGSLQHGRALYYWYNSEQSTVDSREESINDPLMGNGPAPPPPIEERGRDEAAILLWFTLLGATVAKLLSMPLQVAFGLMIDDTNLSFDIVALAGACVAGVASLAVFLLSRLGNIKNTDPGINALFYLSPIMTLLILWYLGIDLHRGDLFAIGAGLIFAINLVIHLKPDAQRDVSRFGDESKSHHRHGFTVLMISLWLFGTFIYLRDEAMPREWIEWRIGDYWALMALSTTIFTLILGFRVTRLRDRINQEDDSIIELFRGSEQLVRDGILDSSFLVLLEKLDAASTKGLFSPYRDAQQYLRDAIDRATGQRQEQERLTSVLRQMDSFTHSKQQGRDVVELFSLTSLAFITIGLGCLAREGPGPAHTATPWNGFLSELFVLVFVSTIPFLMMNLFDMRRERETSLLVPVPEDKIDANRNEYGVFFRAKQRYAADLMWSIVISLGMTMLFVVLFYWKWFVRGADMLAPGG